ncbi:MAG: NfeD family protein [Oscillospiraceae bacterium]|nr:NfeD family protein [Oscillospiraceae bacterium]
MAYFISMPQISMTTVWLVAMVVLLIVEASVPGLVSIWFALGAFAAMLSSLLHAPLWLQCLWFALVSILSLWLTRPFVKKFVNSRTTPTNLDMVIGAECLVIEDIDNVLGSGAVSVGGKEWTARMEDADARAVKGEVVTALRIEGVKLIVKK